jgi:hypothetical protein
MAKKSDERRSPKKDEKKLKDSKAEERSKPPKRKAEETKDEKKHKEGKEQKAVKEKKQKEGKEPRVKSEDRSAKRASSHQCTDQKTRVAEVKEEPILHATVPEDQAPQGQAKNEAAGRKPPEGVEAGQGRDQGNRTSCEGGQVAKEAKAGQDQGDGPKKVEAPEKASGGKGLKLKLPKKSFLHKKLQAKEERLKLPMKSLLEKLQAKEKRGLKLQQDKEEGRKKLKPSKNSRQRRKAGRTVFWPTSSRSGQRKTAPRRTRLVARISTFPRKPPLERRRVWTRRAWTRRVWTRRVWARRAWTSRIWTRRV